MAYLDASIALKDDVILEAIVVLILDELGHCGIERAGVVEDRIISGRTNISASNGGTTKEEAKECTGTWVTEWEESFQNEGSNSQAG